MSPSNGRTCAIAATVLALVSAATCATLVVLGGYRALLLEERVHKSEVQVTEYKSYADHLSAQLQQLQRVDSTLGARLQAIEAGAAAAMSRRKQQGSDGEKEKPKRAKGGDKGKAKDKDEEGAPRKVDGDTKTPKEAGSVVAISGSAEDGADDDKKRGKRRGRKKRSNKG